MKELHLVGPVFRCKRQAVVVRPPMKQAHVHFIVMDGVGFPRLEIEPFRLSQEGIPCDVRSSETGTEEASGGGGMVPSGGIQ